MANPTLLCRPEVLGVFQKAEKQSLTGEIHCEHRDERQIRLDTDRSFVLYPVGEKASPITVRVVVYH